MLTTTHYTLFAEVLDYPQQGYAHRVSELRDALLEACPKAAELLGPFVTQAPLDDLVAIQELFTRSFDVQAITSLDLGYVLFGEDYKRGELLANLSREHREVGNDCGIELGDYLPNVLRLLPLLKDEALREELVQQIVAPALQRMIGEFDPARLASKDALYKKHHKTLIDWSSDKRTIYRVTLQALLEMLAHDFVLLDKPLVEQTADFLKSLDSEMAIENEATT